MGFSYCGISKAEFLESEALQLEQWLNKNMHGKMQYMENYFDKRLDPTKLVPGARSVISLMYNYFPKQQQKDKEAPKISRYAYGEDYHFVIKDKLKIMLNKIQAEIGEVSGRCFVDSAPVLERAWAKRSGVGWIGKNTQLIHPKSGSFYFLAEIICDLELDADAEMQDHCGTCTRCIDACPTDAIVKPYVVDGSKCISYFTIELKEEIPTSYKGKFENWAFGCDICQEVCPWNRFATPHSEPAFDASDEFINMKKQEWLEISEEVFARVFKRSAVQRTAYSGLKRNLKFISKGD